MKKTFTAIALATALSMTSTYAWADRVNQLSDERVRQDRLRDRHGDDR